MQHARGDQQTPAKLQAVDFDLANAGDRGKNALGLMVVARFSLEIRSALRGRLRRASCLSIEVGSDLASSGQSDLEA